MLYSDRLKSRKLSAMILGRFRSKFLRLCGGAWPDDYVCFDLETTGFSRKNDYIVEWGHCIVRDRKPTNRLNIIINWYDSGLVAGGDAWLTKQLHRVRHEMRKAGREFRVTPEIMQRDGVSPEEALPWIFDFLTMLKEQEEILVTHNGWKFDVEMLQNHFQDFMEEEFEFDPNRLIDTGSVEKASQIYDDQRALPCKGETMKDYFIRMAHWILPGVYWNLDTWCVEKYDLANKYGADISEAHAADYDAWLVHLLMEEFRALLAAAPPPINDNQPTSAKPRVPKGRKKPIKKQAVENEPRKRRRGQRNS